MLKHSLTINADQIEGTINRNIYGHFAEHLGRCIYEGIWVGEDSPIENTNGIRNDVVQALKQIKIPVLRWPGGCFADEYHWKDGVGPREQRASMLNTHWGGVVENNHFGTHEFMMLCEMLECEPYICGNVGSGTVHEMQEWIDYMTMSHGTPMSEWRRRNGRDEPWKLKYFGVGNENWGCGGNMRAEYYADLYRQFQTYVRNYGDNVIYKIAGGANSFDTRWTEVLMREAGHLMDGLSVHYYTVEGDRWEDKGSATEYNAEQWFRLLRNAQRTEDLIRQHSAIMDQYDPDKKVGLIVDEWGTWHRVEPGTNPGFLYQQNSIRDALVASVSLNIFNDHCDRVQMANIAQTINVLQAMILTEGERIVLTPSYHVFDMYKVHHDAQKLNIALSGDRYVWEDEEIDAVSASASKDEEGNIHVTMCNVHHESDSQMVIDLRGTGDQTLKASATILTGSDMHAYNDFDHPDRVKPEAYDGIEQVDGMFRVTLPARSVLAIKFASE